MLQPFFASSVVEVAAPEAGPGELWGADEGTQNAWFIHGSVIVCVVQQSAHVTLFG